jgi:predicted TIM-barrel fold metal-dependent hydrolase
LLVVDAQVHVWERVPAQDSGYVHGTAMTADELVDAMAVAGVDRAILVPPTWAEDGNDIALSAARAYPDRLTTPLDWFGGGAGRRP